MSYLVLLFFIHNVLATAILGVLFLKRGGSVAIPFGIGLLLDTIAFAAWGWALISPENLPNLVTLGAVAALVSFVAFLKAGTSDLARATQLRVLLAGAVFVFATFIAGRYVYPSPKFISDDGLLMFNLHPLVQFLYITALVLAAAPTVEKVTLHFAEGYAVLLKSLLNFQIVGAIVLIAIDDVLTLWIAGWCIGLAYFALWALLLFGKGAWKESAATA